MSSPGLLRSGATRFSLSFSTNTAGVLWRLRVADCWLWTDVFNLGLSFLWSNESWVLIWLTVDNKKTKRLKYSNACSEKQNKTWTDLYLVLTGRTFCRGRGTGLKGSGAFSFLKITSPVVSRFFTETFSETKLNLVENAVYVFGLAAGFHFLFLDLLCVFLFRETLTRSCPGAAENRLILWL